jgi:hypothetical protein
MANPSPQRSGKSSAPAPMFTVSRSATPFSTPDIAWIIASAAAMSMLSPSATWRARPKRGLRPASSSTSAASR